MMQFDTIISIYVRHDLILQHALTFFDSFMKMQGQKGKCKDYIKSYSLDRFDRASRAIKNSYSKIYFALITVTLRFLLYVLTGPIIRTVLGNFL